MSYRAISKLTFAALLGMLLFGCGGGGGATPSGGIGGTGVVSSGTITAFGSVWHNGVEYETVGAVFEKNDIIVEASATAGDDQVHFRRGMRVKVNGSNTGATGTATRIEFDNDIKGPISALSVVGTDGRFKDLTIFGRTVRIDRDSTIFDDGVPGFSFSTVAVNDIVEVSALSDAAGIINAGYIELKGDLITTPNPLVELKGIIAGLDTTGNQFSIGTVTVNYSDTTTTFDNVPGSNETGLANGDFVEVKGTYQNATTVQATRIEIEGGLFGNDEVQVEIEGIVTAFVDQSNFSISIDGNPSNTIPVDASGATTIEPGGLFSDGLIGVGTKVEVEGPIVGGTLIAEEVKLRGNLVKVEATVLIIGASSITLQITPTDTVTLNVDTQTQYRDDFGTSPFGLAQIGVGDYLEVRGGWNGSSATLTEVRRRDRDIAPADGNLDGGGDDVILQGPLDAPATTGGLSIMGVNFTFDGGTSFEDGDDSPFPNVAAFVASPNNRTGAIVKVKDNQVGATGLGNGVGDEAEYEN